MAWIHLKSIMLSERPRKKKKTTFFIIPFIWHSRKDKPEVKEESENISLKLNIQKTMIMASGPITSWEIDGKTVADFIFGGAPKSLQMVIAAMKLKDAYSLEEKLWPT